ncbi:hypothetical protein [Rhodoblastus sp.]|uniref:hypothetical protein n=1 Tax=Rhodoblastus sp. TaxID=1962975 RepID=UPI0026337802|nr:hypothetical protein [Rhodoblastus sp.]
MIKGFFLFPGDRRDLASDAPRVVYGWRTNLDVEINFDAEKSGVLALAISTNAINDLSRETGLGPATCPTYADLDRRTLYAFFRRPRAVPKHTEAAGVTVADTAPSPLDALCILRGSPRLVDVMAAGTLPEFPAALARKLGWQ